MSADRSISLRCAAHDHVMVFDAWDVGEPEGAWFMEIFAAPYKPTWRIRFRGAWNWLWGHQPYCQDISLNPGEIIELRDFLNDVYPREP